MINTILLLLLLAAVAAAAALLSLLSLPTAVCCCCCCLAALIMLFASLLLRRFLLAAAAVILAAKPRQPRQPVIIGRSSSRYCCCCRVCCCCCVCCWSIVACCSWCCCCCVTSRCFTVAICCCCCCIFAGRLLAWQSPPLLSMPQHHGDVARLQTGGDNSSRGTPGEQQTVRRNHTAHTRQDGCTLDPPPTHTHSSCTDRCSLCFLAKQHRSRSVGMYALDAISSPLVHSCAVIVLYARVRLHKDAHVTNTQPTLSCRCLHSLLLVRRVTTSPPPALDPLPVGQGDPASTRRTTISSLPHEAAACIHSRSVGVACQQMNCVLVGRGGCSRQPLTAAQPHHNLQLAP